MSKRIVYLFISIFSFILFTIAGYSSFVEYREKPYDDYLFTVSIRCNGENVVIYPYQKYDNYYFLLPSYACDVDAYIIKNKKHSIKLDDIELSAKNRLSDFKEKNVYTLQNDNKKAGSLTFMYGSNIPTIYIQTEDGSLDNNKQNKNLQESASLIIINNGYVDFDNSIEYISGRGNHSWQFDKKGWSLKLLEEFPILGMEKYDEWVLTSNMYDDALGLRNFIAYDMAKKIGLDETSDFRFVDVYIDKMYQGTYLLFEKIGQKKEKLNIGDLDLLNNKSNKTIELEKLKPIQEFNVNDRYPNMSYREFNSPADISGGYIIERNVLHKTGDKDHLFTTANNETFVVRYPSFVNKEELEYIQSIVECVERAIHSDDYIDPISNKQLSELIDIDSFVLKYLVDEFTKNEGAGATSCYYYKKQYIDKLYAGPIWDYDKSLGRYAEWANPEGLSNGMLYNMAKPSDWFDRLYKNIDANKLIKKYYKERIKPYLIELNTNLLDNKKNMIRDSFEMNNIVWGEEFYNEEYYLQSDLIDHVGDLDYSVNYIKNWICEREKFLDKEWVMNNEY